MRTPGQHCRPTSPQHTCRPGTCSGGTELERSRSPVAAIEGAREGTPQHARHGIRWRDPGQSTVSLSTPEVAARFPHTRTWPTPERAEHRRHLSPPLTVAGDRERHRPIPRSVLGRRRRQAYPSAHIPGTGRGKQGQKDSCRHCHGSCPTRRTGCGWGLTPVERVSSHRLTVNATRRRSARAPGRFQSRG